MPHLHPTPAQDRGIGRVTLRLAGSVPAANSVRLPKRPDDSLGAGGRFLYLLLRLVPGKPYAIHADVTAADRALHRLTVSNLHAGQQDARMKRSGVQVRASAGAAGVARNTRPGRCLAVCHMRMPLPAAGLPAGGAGRVDADGYRPAGPGAPGQPLAVPLPARAAGGSEGGMHGGPRRAGHGRPVCLLPRSAQQCFCAVLLPSQLCANMHVRVAFTSDLKFCWQVRCMGPSVEGGRRHQPGAWRGCAA